MINNNLFSMMSRTKMRYMTSVSNMSEMRYRIAMSSVSNMSEVRYRIAMSSMSNMSEVRYRIAMTSMSRLTSMNKMIHRILICIISLYKLTDPKI